MIETKQYGSVSLCLHVCLRHCTCTYVCLRECVCVYVTVCVRVCVSVCERERESIHMYCMCQSVYLVCMGCVYVHTYTHTWPH